MNLLLDIGNSRICWAYWDGVALREPGTVLHRGRDPADCMDFLDQFRSEPSAVFAANVAGAAMADALAGAVAKRWSCPLRFARSERSACGVTNAYLDHRQLGVDRWLGVMAAYLAHQKAVCVVDAGTAITLDQVDNDGRHLGGLIVPGLDLMRGALDRETSDLARLGARRTAVSTPPKSMTAITTLDATLGGSFMAAACLIEHSVKTLRRRHANASLVITGGDAERFLPMLDADADYRPLLVLEGLAARMS
jgi:type III pantothenate kinase